MEPVKVCSRLTAAPVEMTRLCMCSGEAFFPLPWVEMEFLADSILCIRGVPLVGRKLPNMPTKLLLAKLYSLRLWLLVTPM